MALHVPLPGWRRHMVAAFMSVPAVLVIITAGWWAAVCASIALVLPHVFAIDSRSSGSGGEQSLSMRAPVVALLVAQVVVLLGVSWYVRII